MESATAVEGGSAPLRPPSRPPMPTRSTPQPKKTPPQATSYADDFANLFSPRCDLAKVQQLCLSGEMQGSRFRSVAWRVLLQSLPTDKALWANVINGWRSRYTELKTTAALNPRSKEDIDPLINNPLSLDTESPWKQYFLDNELRQCIHQDVERTFPELEYFQSTATRDLMRDILFVYARENPSVCYKQGMHEIVGPILFVLFFDHQSFDHSLEHGGLNHFSPLDQSLLTLLMDAKYIEHDAFNMFERVMAVIRPWYVSGGNGGSGGGDQRPFARAQDGSVETASALVRKLNWIGDGLLKQADPRLYKHLETMEIAPQIYGIRWLRLLFGREFPIQDLLLLWDAIFTVIDYSQNSFPLVDFIFVAMLIFIRQQLLQSDYTGCFHYLMRYPPVVDVHCFLALALHLSNPQRFPKPKAYSFMTFSHITVTGRPHPNVLSKADMTFGKPPSAPSKGASSKAIVSDIEKTGAKFLNSINKMGNKMGNKVTESIKDISMPDDVTSPVSNENIAVYRGVDAKLRGAGRGVSVSQHSSPARALQHRGDTASGRATAGITSRNESASPRLNKHPQPTAVFHDEDIDLLKEQISCLQVRLNDVELNNQAISLGITSCVDRLRTAFGDAASSAVVKDELTDLRRLALALKTSSPPGGTLTSTSTVEIGDDACLMNAAVSSQSEVAAEAVSPTSPTTTYRLPPSLKSENELKVL